MRWLDRLEDRLAGLLEGLITIFFLGIFILTVMLVLLRYGFNSSIIWGSEAMNYLFIYTTALGAAASVSRGTHIKISFLKDMARGRLYKVIDFLGYLLIGLINAVLGWYSLPWIIQVGGFESPVMRVPMWAVQVVVPIGCAFATLFCLVHMFRIVAGMEKREEVA